MGDRLLDRPVAGTDPITREVIRYALLGAVNEMKSVVMRTAYSNLWKEAGDLSCALLNADGDVIAQGEADIPIHLASMPDSLRGCWETIPPHELRPGDVLLQNDPHRGNNHLPDFFMVRPIFCGDAPIAYAAVRGHHIDVGGASPGSYTTTGIDVYAEGLRIPPTRLHAAGEPNEQLLALLEANLRHPRERLGDLRAQLAGCRLGEARVIELAERFGAEVVETAIEEILAASELRARASIGELRDGVYEFEDFCDGDGISDEPIRIHATVEVSEGSVRVDFSGSSPSTRGGMNMPLAVTKSATLYAVKALTEPEEPANSGSYRPVEVIAPEGLVVNPPFGAAVVGGNHETSARVVDVVLGALADAAPDRVVAAGTGTSGVLAFGGTDGEEDFICVEVHGCGQGAGTDCDGGNAHRVSIANTGNTPVEALESSYPLRVLSYGVSRDGGGAGRHRGGCGIERHLRFEHEGWLTLTAERAVAPPYGLHGGWPAAPTRAELRRADGRVEVLPSKTAPILVHAGDELFLKCAGGGGFGPPRERDPALVQRDLDDGYISAAAAREVYEVEVTAATDRAEGTWKVREKDTPAGAPA